MSNNEPKGNKTNVYSESTADTIEPSVFWYAKNFEEYEVEHACYDCLELDIELVEGYFIDSCAKCGSIDTTTYLVEVEE